MIPQAVEEVLLLAIGDQEICLASWLIDSPQSMAQKADEIFWTVLRGGVEMRWILDVSASRRSFLGSE